MEGKQPRGIPVLRLNRVVHLFFTQTLSQIDADMRMQHIWPDEIYPGFAEVNAIRKKKGQWFSTGRGAKSFRGKHTKIASEEDTSIAILFSYNDYLRYAELGVGKGVKAEDGKRSKKGHYNVRYTRVWNRRKGKSHRPLMYEFRHLQTRLMNYMTDYYCETITTNILVGIPDKIDIGALI